MKEMEKVEDDSYTSSLIVGQMETLIIDTEDPGGEQGSEEMW